MMNCSAQLRNKKKRQCLPRRSQRGRAATLQYEKNDGYRFAPPILHPHLALLPLGILKKFVIFVTFVVGIAFSSLVAASPRRVLRGEQ
jgi:hypothetical protein